MGRSPTPGLAPWAKFFRRSAASTVLPTVASFLPFPSRDPLFSSKSVASFFKSSQLSAVSS